MTTRDPVGGAGEAPRSLLATVRELAFPRAVGSDGERCAQELVVAALEREGLAVEREPFRFARSALLRARLVLHGLAAAATIGAGLAMAAFPALALGLAAGALALVARAGSWPRQIERAFDGSPQVESERSWRADRSPRAGALPVGPSS